MAQQQKAVEAVNGARADVAARPEPSEAEQKAILEALSRWLNASKHPGVKVDVEDKGDGNKSVSVDSPHSNYAGWLARMAESFGSSSGSFPFTQLRHLASIAAASSNPQSVTNAMLAAVQSFEPQNEMEAQIAVQMAATHQAAMVALENIGAARTTEAAERYGTLANKLLRTYTMQMEAAARLRRHGEQTVRVEHVHVYEGGQAIVGAVNAPVGTGRGVLENGRQPHALTGSAAFAIPVGAPMLRQDTGGAGMPSAGREREEAVPDARRRQRKRRAEG